MLYITKHLVNSSFHPKVIVATRGVHYFVDQTNVFPSQATVWGIAKSYLFERPDTRIIVVDLDPDNSDASVDSEQLFCETWLNDEHLFAYRENKRYVVRCIKMQNSNSSLVLPERRYKIVIPESKKINDISFKTPPYCAVDQNEIEILIKSTSLNFRDIMVIIKPENFHTEKEAVGTDFSGIISNIGDNVSKFKIGDEVYGFATNGCIASHVIEHEDCLFKMPKEITFEEASTLPSVLLTAHYCLINIANLKRGETILIHVASGGVGLVAIQIAQSIGANIIATAGKKRKRNYLRSIGVKHVFNSRDLFFGENIDVATNGCGVDMVLNSLTGHGFKETSLKACARNARFVAMGKLNIWQPDDVKKLRPDIVYTIVNLELLTREEMGSLMNTMDELVQNGHIKPIPYTRFFASQVKDALNYFSKANHIGKIVVTMPKMVKSLDQKVTKEPLFNNKGTYLITGGLGGIGLEVAKWMGKYGAKHIVLVGRTAPSEATLQVLKAMAAINIEIVSLQEHVGDMQQCVTMFEQIKTSMLSLRGVIHSAGALSDGMIRSQTWNKYKEVFNAKVKGGWNLHELTKDLQLEHFVVFSSVAALFAPLGQSNHCAANMYLDSLVYYRHSLGLPAQTINWGPWSEIGAATNTTHGTEGFLGGKPFSPTQGIAALQYIMNRPVLQAKVLQFNPKEIESADVWLSIYLPELLEDENVSYSKTSAQGGSIWNDIIPLNEEDRFLYIKKCVETILRMTLKLSESEDIDDHQEFSEMGVDSLLAVEMRNKLQKLFGKDLSLNPTSLLDFPTLSGFCKHLVVSNLTISVNIESTEGNNTEQLVKELIAVDSVLPAHIEVSTQAIAPSKIRSILITGVTGHFGPYLLSELVKRAELKIFCLIRAKTLPMAQRKLQENLNKFGLTDSAPLTNVTVVLGDITQSKLGMDNEEYKKLAYSVESVFHCAVKANHIEEYKRTKSNNCIRTVNVLGTINILEFAAAWKTKRVTYVSSYIAANIIREDGYVPDEFPLEDNNAEGLGGGYALTKFVCEKLMAQAIMRGIPCIVLRFPTLIGHSETGRFTTDANFSMNFFFISVQLKLLVDIPGRWFFIPIDVAAQISNNLVFNDQFESGLYNVMNNEPMSSQEYIKVASEMGIPLRLVNLEEFAEILNSEKNPLMEVFREATRGKELKETFYAFSPVLKQAIENNKKVFRMSNKLCSFVDDIQNMIPSPTVSLKNLFNFAITSGMFHQMGIEYDTNNGVV